MPSRALQIRHEKAERHQNQERIQGLKMPLGAGSTRTMRYENRSEITPLRLVFCSCLAHSKCLHSGSQPLAARLQARAAGGPSAAERLHGALRFALAFASNTVVMASRAPQTMNTSTSVRRMNRHGLLLMFR